jgi:hypothetical protein
VVNKSILQCKPRLYSHNIRDNMLAFLPSYPTDPGCLPCSDGAYPPLVSVQNSTSPAPIFHSIFSSNRKLNRWRADAILQFLPYTKACRNETYIGYLSVCCHIALRDSFLHCSPRIGNSQGRHIDINNGKELRSAKVALFSMISV